MFNSYIWGCYNKTKASYLINFPGRQKTSKWQESSVHVKNILYVIHVSQLQAIQDLHMGYIICRSFVSREKTKAQFDIRVSENTLFFSRFPRPFPRRHVGRESYNPSESVFRCGTEVTIFKVRFYLFNVSSVNPLSLGFGLGLENINRLIELTVSVITPWLMGRSQWTFYESRLSSFWDIACYIAIEISWLNFYIGVHIMNDMICVLWTVTFSKRIAVTF